MNEWIMMHPFQHHSLAILCHIHATLFDKQDTESYQHGHEPADLKSHGLHFKAQSFALAL
jgi:hypothetical protein